MIERQYNSQQGHQAGRVRESLNISTGIQAIIQKIKGFKRTAAALEKQAEGTSCLVSFNDHDTKETFKTNNHVFSYQSC
jgi:hypothetical protein